MKISKQQLKKIIQEELASSLSEDLGAQLRYTSSAPAGERYKAAGATGALGSDPRDEEVSLSDEDESWVGLSSREVNQKLEDEFGITYTKNWYKRLPYRHPAREKYREWYASGRGAKRMDFPPPPDEVVVDAPEDEAPVAPAGPAVPGGGGELPMQIAAAKARIARWEESIAKRTKSMKVRDPFFNPETDPRINKMKGALERKKAELAELESKLQAQGAPATASINENRKITSLSLKNLIRKILKTDYQ